MVQAPDDMTLSPSTCRACGSESTRPHLEKGGHRYLRCLGCGLVFADIAEDELVRINREVYDQEFGGELPSVESEFSRKKVRRHHEILGKLAPHRGEGRILEIGCGNGAFLQTAREVGWSPAGLEIAGEAAAAARSRGLEIHEAFLHECELESESLDAIVMNEVLEHVWDPRSLLVEIHRLLRPGGALFLRTRNPESWTAAFCGPRWHHYSVREQGHVSFFPPRSFRKVLTDIGFGEVRVRTWGSAYDDRFPAESKGMRKTVRALGKIVAPLETWLEKGQRIEVLAIR